MYLLSLFCLYHIFTIYLHVGYIHLINNSPFTFPFALHLFIIIKMLKANGQIMCKRQLSMKLFDLFSYEVVV